MHVCVLWQLIGGEMAHAYAFVCCGQLIDEKVAHAYACVCVLSQLIVRNCLMHMHVCVFWQLIGGEVAHAYACVCVLAADWWLGGLCICMCVCSGS